MAGPVIVENVADRFDSRARPCMCTGPVEIVAVITGAGLKQYRVLCLVCSVGHSKRFNLPHGNLTASERTRARVVKINKPTPPLECERCGAIGAVESHHIAPQAKFADADLWPTVRLCRPCHIRWHQTIDK